MTGLREGRGSVERVYDRTARFYDLMDGPMDWLGGRRRRARVLGRAEGEVLEVGIGTGRNLSHYPSAVRLTGVDLSEQMLARAVRRAAKLGAEVSLEHADVERLPFAADTFDTVAATCVFCSVADPVSGLKEVRRACKPDGRVLLLEHVRPRNRFLGWLFDRLTPLTRRAFGPAINRRTEENVASAGLEIIEVRSTGVWREIVARPGEAS